MFFPSDWGKTGKHQGNGGPKFVFLSFHSYFAGQEQPGTTHIFTKTIHGFVFSIPKMSVNASPNSFTTRHPSPILLWKDWSGSLSIEYFTKLWILQTSSYFGRRHQPKKNILIYIDYITGICCIFVQPFLAPKHRRIQPDVALGYHNTSPTLWSTRPVLLTKPYFGKQVSLLHDQIFWKVYFP